MTSYVSLILWRRTWAANLLEDLRGAVETALRLISQTVNGHFISSTERDTKGRPGGQFFLDVTKVVDFDTQIARRAESINDQARNRYYYEALKLVLECTDQPYVLLSPRFRGARCSSAVGPTGPLSGRE